MSVVFYTEFPCNITSHPYYRFCEGSGWGNEEATVACRELGNQYGIGGECIDHDHIFEINPRSCDCHSIVSVLLKLPSTVHRCQNLLIPLVDCK